MRIFNRAHVPWFVFVLGATIIAAVLYAGNFAPDILPDALQLPAFLKQRPSGHRSVGGTPLGLIFGAIAFGIFIFAGLLGLRKKIVLWRMGTVQSWLRAHIWLTLLTIPLVLFHTGFRLGGSMTTWLWILYAIVMVSGIYGLALQHQLPRIMKERLRSETVYEQIPYIRAQLVTTAEKMRDSFRTGLLTKPRPESIMAAEPVTADAGRGGTTEPGAAQPQPEPAPPAAPAIDTQEHDPDSEDLLADFIDKQVLPYLSAHRGDRLRLGNNRYSEDLFRMVKLRVTELYRGRVEEIQGWCDERRLLDLQLRFQHWLHGWLFLHVPISYFLILFTAWHGYVTLFHY